MSDTAPTSDQSVSKIDQAIAAARARAAVKASSSEGTPSTPKAPKATASEPKRPRQTDEEKAAKLAAREAERTERKAARAAAAAEKLANKKANQPVSHMKKVMRAAEGLSPLDQAALLLFNEATTSLSNSSLAALASHILQFNRVNATLRATQTTLVVGQEVRIVGGDPRYIGKTGTVVTAQKIRCNVNIPGANNRPIANTDKSGVYMYTSDVEPLVAETASTETTSALG